MEKYGLASQMQRAAVSIPSNIAEGYRRNSKKDFKRFLSISIGSAAELETQLIITERLYGVEVDSEIQELVEIQRTILSFQKKLA